MDLRPQASGARSRVRIKNSALYSFWAKSLVYQGNHWEFFCVEEIVENLWCSSEAKITDLEAQNYGSASTPLFDILK